MRFFIILLALGFMTACGGGGDTSSGDEFAYCNSRSNSLEEYAKCRCRTLTGSKSLTPEMDRCLTDPKVYAQGYKGEIPQRLRDKMQ